MFAVSVTPHQKIWQPTEKRTVRELLVIYLIINIGPIVTF